MDNNTKSGLKKLLWTVLIAYFITIILFVLRFTFGNSFMRLASSLSNGVALSLLGVFYAKWQKQIKKSVTFQKYQIESNCHACSLPIGCVKGIVIHSTGFNDPNLKRYVDHPQAVGYNKEGNHWNQRGDFKMAHIFVGYDKNKNIAMVNTISYEISCFACGKGINGSYDLSPNGHLQIQICEDSMEDEVYFKEAVFNATVEACIMLRQKFKLKVDTIISDKEAFEAGYAKEYSGFEIWLKKFGYTMEDFRKAVSVKGKPISLLIKSSRFL